MSFLHPWAFVAGIAAALGVIALHLLSTRRPPATPLPTARFVPPTEQRAVARTTRPTDIPLLLLRVLSALLVGAAFAQPLPDAPGPALRRVVALEWTTAITDVEAARASAQRLLGPGDALVVYDTAARVMDAAALAALPLPTLRRASLSPMFVAAQDAATRIARGADSLRLTILGTFPGNAMDAATPALRAAWPGGIEFTPLAATADTAPAAAAEILGAAANDPLRPALQALRRGTGSPALRLRVGALVAEDSQWLAAMPGRVLVRWPEHSADSLPADGVFAANGRSAALVAPLGRRAVGDGRVIARWRDGSPAASEQAVGQGCLREVGVVLPLAGDLTLRAPFQRLLAVLTEPCGGARTAALPDSLRERMAPRPDAAPGEAMRLAPASAFLGDEASSPLTPWLLAAALVALLAEQWLRRRAPAEAA